MNSEFKKNFIVLFTGTTAAQAVAFLFEPVISRLYLPEEFAVFELYVAFIMMIGSIVTLRYEMAIVLPLKKLKALNLMGLAFVITIIISVLTLVIFILLGNTISLLLNNSEIAHYYWIIPIGVFIFGTYRSLFYWFMRKKKFTLIGTTKITESTTKAISTTSFGFLHFSSWGLVFGQFLGQFFAIFPLLWKFIKQDRKLLSFITWKQMKLQAKEYSVFPKVNVPQTIIDMLQLSGVVFIISAFFTPDILGQYAKAIRIMVIPLSLIGTSINQVFYQKAASIYQKGGDLRVQTAKLSLALAVVSIPFIIIGLLFSPQIFAFVLGDNWYEAGVMAAIMLPWFFLKFVLSVALSIPIIVNEQKTFLSISIIGNILLIISVIIGGNYFQDIYKTLYLLTWSQVVYNIGIAIWLYKIAAKKNRNNG